MQVKAFLMSQTHFNPTNKIWRRDSVYAEFILTLKLESLFPVDSRLNKSIVES